MLCWPGHLGLLPLLAAGLLFAAADVAAERAEVASLPTLQTENRDLTGLLREVQAAHGPLEFERRRLTDQLAGDESTLQGATLRRPGRGVRPRY